jgi:hypothetical protein
VAPATTCRLALAQDDKVDVGTARMRWLQRVRTPAGRAPALVLHLVLSLEEKKGE